MSERASDAPVSNPDGGEGVSEAGCLRAEFDSLMRREGIQVPESLTEGTYSWFLELRRLAARLDSSAEYMGEPAVTFRVDEVLRGYEGAVDHDG